MITTQQTECDNCSEEFEMTGGDWGMCPHHGLLYCPECQCPACEELSSQEGSKTED